MLNATYDPAEFVGHAAKKNHALLWLLLASFLLRLVVVYFIRDTHVANEWGTLLHNMVAHKTYAFHTFNHKLIPTAYMPPLYPFFLYGLKTITSFDDAQLVMLVIFIQMVLAVGAVYVFYKINQYFFCDRLSLLSAGIFSLLPLHVIACGRISSITLQLFLSLLFLWGLMLLLYQKKVSHVLFLGIVSGFLLLIRGEFLLVFAGYMCLLWMSKKVKLAHLLSITIIAFSIISPYVVRNYSHFNQVVIVKVFGFALWKGNNPFSPVGGYEDINNPSFAVLKSDIAHLPKDSRYEMRRDHLFSQDAMHHLRQTPLHYVALSIKRFFSYYFIDLNSVYPGYNNLFHTLPVMLIAMLSFCGLFTFFRQHGFAGICIGFYLLINLSLFSVFFILPRYKLMILPVQVMLASHVIAEIIKMRYNNRVMGLPRRSVE